MSFGSSSRPRRLVADAPCPCGSGDLAGGCCGPLIAGGSAPTPARLMRSRYTAFTIGDSDYLARTWHPRTRPATVTLDPGISWERLEVFEEEVQGDAGTVAFRAYWRDGAQRGVLAERSTFERRAQRWFYVDGDIGER